MPPHSKPPCAFVQIVEFLKVQAGEGFSDQHSVPTVFDALSFRERAQQQALALVRRFHVIRPRGKKARAFPIFPIEAIQELHQQRTGTCLRRVIVDGGVIHDFNGEFVHVIPVLVGNAVGCH